MSKVITELDTFQEESDLTTSNHSISAREMVCHFCNEKFHMEDLHPGEQIDCLRCEETLIRIENYPILTPIIYAFLALFAFILSLIFPLITIVIPIVEDKTSSSIWSIFHYLSSSGYVFLTFVFVLFVIITPLIFIICTLYVYLGLYFKKNFFKIRDVAYIVAVLRPWIMVDIFFISVVVALVKIKALASVYFGYTMVTMFGYSIFLARIVLTISDYWLSEKLLNLTGETVAVHQMSSAEIKEKARLKIHFSWVLLMTSTVFYVLANIFPMMITDGVLFHAEKTILEGVIEIWNSGDPFIAIVIFVASFLIPVAKIFILFIILLAISYKKIMSPKRLTWCYVAIERIGRWSMIDVFVIMLMASLFTTQIVSIFPGAAIIYFCLVVNITMVATSIIDTRLLWVDEESEDMT